jgi:iron(III) transport system permease protein
LGTLQLAATEIWEPLKASFVWTALAATAAAILAWALAWTARHSTFWRLVAALALALTLAAPGPVAGMALVLAYRTWPAIYDSPSMIVMAESLRSLPYALLLLWPFLRAFPEEYLETAAIEGHTPWGQIVHVVLPMSRRPLLAAWAIAFAIGLGELPATNLTAPPGTQPVSVLIWGLLHTGVESHLSGVALIMLMVVAASGLVAALAVRSLQTLASSGTA